jgi:uncharacterized protein YndB with AHSA1/START domain
MSNETTTEGITITREFDAPRELVFRTWTEPELFADWFGGAEAEVPVDSVSMDVRPGGAWQAKMLTEQGEIPWHGEYREVVEPERLVLTFKDRPGDEYELVVVDFTDAGDGRTQMQLRQTGGHMDSAEYERARQGWGVFFDRMDQLLAEQA